MLSTTTTPRPGDRALSRRVVPIHAAARHRDPVEAARKLPGRPSARWSVAADGRLHCIWYQPTTPGWVQNAEPVGRGSEGDSVVARATCPHQDSRPPAFTYRRADQLASLGAREGY